MHGFDRTQSLQKNSEVLKKHRRKLEKKKREEEREEIISRIIGVKGNLSQ
jgi:hypothetical protein